MDYKIFKTDKFPVKDYMGNKIYVWRESWNVQMDTGEILYGALSEKQLKKFL